MLSTRSPARKSMHCIILFMWSSQMQTHLERCGPEEPPALDGGGETRKEVHGNLRGEETTLYLAFYSLYIVLVHIFIRMAVTRVYSRKIY